MIYIKSFYYLASACFVVFCFFTGLEKSKEKEQLENLKFQFTEVGMDSVIKKVNQLREINTLEEALSLYLSFRELYKEIEPEFYAIKPDSWQAINDSNSLGNLERCLFGAEGSRKGVQKWSSLFMKQLLIPNKARIKKSIDSSDYIILKYKLATYHLIKSQDSPIMDLNHSEAVDSYKVLSLTTQFHKSLSYNNIELDDFLSLSLEIIESKESKREMAEMKKELLKVYQQIADPELIEEQNIDYNYDTFALKSIPL